jgi:hypothetical protein
MGAQRFSGSYSVALQRGLEKRPVLAAGSLPR